MILKASQRSGGKQLGAHLLKTEENEHVEVHEVSGFISETIEGAMKEAYALSKGTRCEQYLFSVSLNPPQDVAVDVAAFEAAIRGIEEKTGLVGQPRMIVFHEKEGRRHCHAVWSRIDAETMKAKPLPFFKMKLRDLAKELYLEYGWELPKGFADPALRDPRNFTLDEWQQAKRSHVDARELKAAAQAAWKSSDNATSFARALEELGLFLAKGDRRGHVAVTVEGEVFPISRLVGEKTKAVTARLGLPDGLKSVQQTVHILAGDMGKRMRLHIAEARRLAANAMKPLIARREEMKSAHKAERANLAESQLKRSAQEQKNRAARIRGGARGLWDIMTGRYFKTRRANELEAMQGVQRDRAQSHALRVAQGEDRQKLQQEIRSKRERHATQVLALYRDAARFRHEQLSQGNNRDPELGR
ncbi:relaxase/mobilization nuclease domain-containing protein [Sphingobium sp. HWE2-09]|uniref:relaxase/mobilization nuclease domain-containing protein n=1 Tax=Sphingobium sp. HWE2-09 TaxID=3108390 RepID=UPI002DC45AC5|nr:relaxase/mobilization nuclease domain-containing protein [Sphingobium sp. HWE2-09]